MLILAAVALALVVITGCATTSEFDTLRSDVTALRMEQVSQKKELSQLRERMGEMSKDVTSVTGIRDSQSSLLTQSSDVMKELQSLRGRFDEYKYFMDKTVRDLRTERDVQQAKITALENTLKEMRAKADAERGVAPEESKETPGTPQEKSVSPPSPSDSQRLYDDGQIAFKEKRYGEARQKFERLIKDHPKHALVPNAYYWTGESYYAEKKFEDAILAYETLLKTFPSHDKARGAMLKQAYSFIELGDKKTGKVILERVIEKYPQSAEAELAEKKLAEISPKKPAPPKKKK
ncbi:MAG: tol-pal system protein YbgF [Chloroflexota bacterium]